MKIEVNQEHIDKAVRGEAEYCPIALALKGKLHRAAYVSDTTLHYYTSSGNTVDKVMPAVAQKFVVGFDKGKKVRPFTFEI